MRAEPAAGPVLHSIYMMRVLTTSNENKMSDDGRERASLGVGMLKSSQEWSVQRSAVRSIAWLGLFWLHRKTNWLRLTAWNTNRNIAASIYRPEGPPEHTMLLEEFCGRGHRARGVCPTATGTLNQHVTRHRNIRSCIGQNSDDSSKGRIRDSQGVPGGIVEVEDQARRATRQKQCGQKQKWGVAHRPNENKMSDGGRERASLGVEVWKSSQK